MKPDILPMKTAAELWAQSGPDMWLYRWSREGLAHLQGKGPRCAMTAAEYWDYERLRAAPQVSAVAAQDLGILEPDQMICVLRDRDELQRIYTALETSLTEVTVLITSAQQALSVEDYGDGLAGALRRLELCVRCVKSLRTVKDCEVHLQADVLPFKKALAAAQSEIKRLRGLGDRGSQTIRHTDDLKRAVEQDNELEAVREWHRAESEACIAELLHGVPDEGGNVKRYYLSQLIKMAFLSGAVEQLTRPFVRQQNTGGPDAA